MDLILRQQEACVFNIARRAAIDWQLRERSCVLFTSRLREFVSNHYACIYATLGYSFCSVHYLPALSGTTSVLSGFSYD